MKNSWRILGLILLAASVSSGAQTIVSLTFDDGVSDAPAAQQLLDKYGFKGTFYIISNVLGSGGYMTVAQVKAIQAAGHEIAGHTITHGHLTAMTTAQATHEICDGKTQLENLGLGPITNFAYPFGESNAAIEAIAASCYTSARGAWMLGCDYDGCSPAESIPPIDAFWIRTPDAVLTTTTLDQLKAQVTVAENAGGGWVPMQFHHVCNGGCDDYSVTPANLDAFLSWLKLRASSGTVVQTVDQVMNGITHPRPFLSSISPQSVLAGGTSFTLTVNGTHFSSSCVVQVNGQTRATTFQNSSRLTAILLAGDIDTPGNATITVFDPDPKGGASNGLTLTIVDPIPPNPTPTLASIMPSSATIGSSDLTITVKGTNFISSSTVRWNGSVRPTTFISSTTLSAAIPASNLSALGISSVTVFNPAPGGGTSTVKTFSVYNPEPVLVDLSTNSVVLGSGGFNLTLTGTNFLSTSNVRWNGSPRATTFISSTSLRASILSTDIASTGTYNVTVFNPAPGGGTSTVKTFTVVNPEPVLVSLSTNSMVVGDGGFNLTVTGTNFLTASNVRWNGSPRATTYISSTSLRASILSTDIASTGTYNVTVFNPAPGGGASTVKTFSVYNPEPVLVDLSTNSVVLGSGGFNLTVTGTNFLNVSSVRWNGSPRATTFISSTSLRVSILSTDIASTGTYNVTVFNPAPGGGTSTPKTFSVYNPEPVLVGLSTNSVVAGSGEFNLTVTGMNFLNASYVLWNGSPRATTFVSSKTLVAAIGANDVVSSGTVTVTVFNPAPGGGTSAGVAFIIASSPVGGGTGLPNGLPPPPDPSTVIYANFSQARVYPNPWRKNLPNGRKITFDRLPSGSTVKIYTISAHWVATLEAPLGSVDWDLTNNSGDVLASGYYLYVMSNSAIGTVRGTLAIIR